MSKKPKKALKKYEVTIEREIRHHAVVEVEAESVDVAKQMAVIVADNGNPYSNSYSNYWTKGDTVSETIKAKVKS